MKGDKVLLAFGTSLVIGGVLGTIIEGFNTFPIFALFILLGSVFIGYALRGIQ